MNTFLLVGALIYAMAFWLICFRYPAVALMMIFASAPFQNDLSGGGGVKFSFAEINLMLALPIFILQHKRLSIGPLVWPVVAYLGVCAASGFLNWHGKDSLVSFIQMLLYMIVIVMVFASMTPKPEDVRLALFGVLPIALFMAALIIITRQQYILNMHKNGIGGSLSVALLVALELWFNLRAGWRKWAMVAVMIVIAAGLTLTLSRGAWLGAICGAFVLTAMRRQWLLMGRAALLMLPVLWLAWGALPQEQREYASSFNSKRYNIEARYQSVEIAARYWRKNYLLGDGVGLRKQYDATNLIWMVLAETGILGVLTWGAVHIAFYRMVWQTQAKIARDDPLYSLVAIGGALVTARLMHGMVDHYWSRGPTMMAWAAAGMALGAYFAVQHQRAIGFNSPRFKVLLALDAIEKHRSEQQNQRTSEIA